MAKQEHIKLFYWSSMYFENKPQENFGDVLSRYIVEHIAGISTRFYNLPKKKKRWVKPKYLMAIGSILNYATKKAVVWGSGIISKQDTFEKATFIAVRGPKTRDRVLQLGIECPEVYGDPALLLPLYYNPKPEKKYKLGIIPHYVDYEKVNAWYKSDTSILVINLLNNDIHEVTNQIHSCEHTISSSLHGVIVSQAYHIPSIWIKFSEKLSGDNIKFEDYFLSVNLTPYNAEFIEEKLPYETLLLKFKNFDSSIIQPETLKAVQKNLLAAFPYEAFQLKQPELW